MSGRSLRRNRQLPPGDNVGPGEKIPAARLGGGHRVLRTSAIMPFKERGELLGIGRGQPKNDARLAPRLFERISHVAGDGRHRISQQPMDYTPVLPSPLKRRCGQLSLEHQFWIPHGDPPSSDGTLPPDGGPPGRRWLTSLMCRASRRTRADQRTAVHRRFPCPLPVTGLGHGDKYGLPAAASRGDYLKLLHECNAILREKIGPLSVRAVGPS